MSTQPAAPKTVTCTRCNGIGWTQWAHGVNGNCPDCYGFGVVNIYGDGDAPTPCRHCGKCTCDCEDWLVMMAGEIQNEQR